MFRIVPVPRPKDKDAAFLPSDPSPTLTYPAETGSGWRVRGVARGSSRIPASCRLPSEAPLAVQLFPADGVTWVVPLPTGLAAETIWPDMEWIEALREEVQTA